MLKLLLVTLGTWSLVSLFLVGVLGFLICLREQRACTVGGSKGAKLLMNCAHTVATRRSGKPAEPRAVRTAS
jgi:hypothetical protein